jgi:D-lactate dehydrogenase
MINAVKRLFGNKKIYHWNQHIGYPSKIITADSDSFEFLYFPTCISRITGKPSDTSANSLVSTIQRIAKKANINLKIPANVNNYCCGTVFNSKGFYDAYVNSINKLMEMLWRESDEGKLPVVFDASSCLHTVRNCRPDLNANTRVKYDLMTILDLSEFISDYILPRINIKSKLNRVILHQNCSVRKLNIENRMESIAANCADEVIIPESQSCCGMGGDRGLIFPELTQSATKYESAEVRNVHADGFYSSNLPCEAAMSQETNKNYLSIAYLVDKVSD